MMNEAYLFVKQILILFSANTRKNLKERRDIQSETENKQPWYNRVNHKNQN